MRKPLAIDLFCGLGGWTEALLAEGWRVIGFDIERHDYGSGGYPGQLVLQDVRTIHGAQFRDADLIVASPPCQFFSRMAMPFKCPWKREEFERRRNLSLTLFWSCWRIQHEACEAAGTDIPLIVENVVGAQRWVGAAQWHHRSFYLWGDVPALMPIPREGQKLPVGHDTFRKNGKPCMHFTNPLEGSNSADGLKRPGRKIGAGFNNWPKDESGAYIMPDGTKVGHDWFGSGEDCSLQRRASSRSQARKAASAQIAKIPEPLARHIAQVFKPRAVEVCA